MSVRTLMPIHGEAYLEKVRRRRRTKRNNEKDGITFNLLCIIKGGGGMVYLIPISMGGGLISALLFSGLAPYFAFVLPCQISSSRNCQLRSMYIRTERTVRMWYA